MQVVERMPMRPLNSSLTTALSGAELSDRLEPAIGQAARALLDLQRGDGHWAFALEAAETIPAEYILLLHYLGENDAAAEQRVHTYLLTLHGANDCYTHFPNN